MPTSTEKAPIPLRALIIEDNSSDAELMAEQLRAGGFAPDVVRVDTMSEIRRHLSTPPDVILSDFHVPGVDLLTVLREVRALAVDVPFIVVSGVIGEEEGLESLRDGADEYIWKDRMRGLGHAVRRAMNRRVHQDALRRSEAHNRLLARALESTDQMVSVTDTADRFTYVNNSFLEAYGYECGEVIGKTPAILRTLDVPKPVSDQILAESHAGSWTGELVNRRKDGSRFWVSLRTSLIRDEHGGWLGMLGVARDISEQRHAEHLKNTTEERTRYALEAAGIGVWEHDAATGSMKWSDALQRLHGMEPGTFGDSTDAFIRLVHPQDQAAVRDGLMAALADHTDAIYEYRVVWPDGSTHWLIGKGRFFRTAGDAVTGGVGIGIDVTDRKQLETQLAQSQKMEAIGHLAGGIAHDFNNLLTAILGYADLLIPVLEGNDVGLKDLEQIHKAGTRATNLTRQLLAFSRRQILQPVVLDLNAVATDLMGLIRRVIGEDIVIKLDLDPDIGCVQADPGQIEQVIMNLAVNARDAMAQGGTLTIETGSLDVDDDFFRRHGIAIEKSVRRLVVLTVSDTGVGMDRAVRDRIFEPFFTTKPQGHGTGLGLATVYGIVKQSGGSIWVYSEPGQGATFKIYLPRTEGAVLPVQVHEESKTRVGSETILFVEDEHAVRTLGRDLLRRHGYRVLEAANAEQAIGVAGSFAEPIDLLLTDVVMPGRSGPELFDYLVRERDGLKVMYLSGYTDAAVVRRGELGAGAAFLQKPFTAKGLMKKLRDVLDRAPA